MTGWSVDVSGATAIMGPQGGVSLRAKERSIVAALALHHPSPATAASLAPLIWGDELPTTAIKSIHNHVSRIRTATPDLIDTSGHGYQFRADIEIRCSGGPSSYSDLADQPTVAVARARDRVLALRVAEDEHRDRVRQGADDHLLRDLEQLVDAAPQRLLRWWWVALVSARLGRRRQALDTLRACRRGPVHLDAAARGALDLFERAIADDDVFLDSPAAADPRSLGAETTAGPDPSSTVAPVGIIDATGAIAEIVAALDGRVSTMSIVAPAGGGKSSALRSIAEQLPPLGWNCFSTTCSATDVDPLAPLVDLDRQRRERSGRDRPRRHDGDAAGDYSKALLESLTIDGTRRALLIIDDVHHATPATVDHLDRLAARVTDLAGRVSVLFASRPSATQTIATQQSNDLPSWGRTAIDAYVHSFVSPGVWSIGAARWIEDRADGNALFVRELTIDALRRLPDDPAVTPFIEPNVASLVSGGFELSVDSLPEKLRTTLIKAAVLGEEFRRTDLAALAENVSPMLALGQAHGLIDTVGPERCRFVHQRFRQSFLDLISTDEQVALAQRVAGVIGASTNGSPDDEARLAELALFARSASSRDPERAIEATMAQAHTAFNKLRMEEALSLARLAIELIDDFEGHSQRWATMTVLAGMAAVETGDEHAVELLVTGAQRAMRLENHETVAKAAIRLCDINPSSAVGRVDAATQELLDHTYQHVTDPATRALVCGAWSIAASIADDPVTSRRLYLEADALSSAAGDSMVRTEVLAMAYTPLSSPDDFDERRRISAELHERGTQLDRPDLVYAAHRLDFANAISVGSADPRPAMAAIEDIAAQLGQRSRNWSLFAFRATVALLDGDLEAAEHHTNALLSDQVTVSSELVTSTYGAHLCAIRLLQHRMHELDPLVMTLQRDQPELAIWQAVRVATAAVDLPDEARTAFDRVFEVDQHHIPHNFTMLGGLVIAGEGAIQLGDESRIRIMIGHLTPFEDRWGWFNVGSVGPVDLTLARLHAAVGETELARACITRGLQSTARVGAPTYAGELARLLGSLR
ncbi:MAG: hypothetical protein AB8G14_18635 [Ilumatobacter sp.]